MSRTVVFVIVAVVAVCVLAVAAALIWRAWKRWRRVQRLNKRDDDQVRYAFIINPSKPQAARSRLHIEEFCKDHNITDIEFIETTLERDGRVCALEALEHGADVLVAVGGDGTVRTVASAVSGTGHTLAIIPIGTGNLFARNMGIPVDDINAALAIATSHGSRMVDMGRMALLDKPGEDHAHAFLIIAGIGFDADMISDTSPELKKSISWLAYFSGGMKHLFAPKYRGAITITSADGSSHTVGDVHFRTFMAGNCGQIPVFSLMPDASFDDGLLDFEIIDTSGGILGWMNLFGDVMHQTITGKAQQSPLSTNSTMDQIQGVKAEIKLENPALAQVDGDMLGSTSHIRFSVEPKSLRVRVPAKEEIEQYQ
ncbi:diacylglycerol kinase family protein [Bifidobacterium sp. ESL0728]|uniref:diacylglycerol/lipid kinase family protein n=1 Tax=Bifidobacterium sp. ESL0728 TaxID=2983220 RepID=UPI0023FA3983|nr:diacylglycerol kinase family protein [Bifidobacterium sp. ESL0728]WEV59472.1 diacylglycerol kinase family protein [Bifidobacterium sp. ESL0728]